MVMMKSKVDYDVLQVNKKIPNLNQYIKKVDEIKSYLKDGETYQINYSNPIEYSYQKSKFALYLHLRNIAKPANGIYLNNMITAWRKLASSGLVCGMDIVERAGLTMM